MLEAGGKQPKRGSCATYVLNQLRHPSPDFAVFTCSL